MLLFSKKNKWFSLLVIVMLPLLLSLAYWQWQRGIYKDQQLTAYEVNHQPVNFSGHVSLPMKPYQLMHITGRFKPQWQFFLDNQMVQGRAGFYILVPFVLQDSHEWLLVNLGWLPRHAKRLELPNIPTIPEEQVTLTGLAYFPSQGHLLLGTHLEKIQSDKIIIQTLDLPLLSDFLKHDLLPIVLLQESQENKVFVQDWQPSQAMPAAKHYGYAVQWLLLAITLFVLYFIYMRKQ